MTNEQQLSSTCDDLDPWKSAGKEKNLDDFYFEDSFMAIDPDTIAQLKKDYIPLDDSNQYLASLEKKLSKLKGPQTRKDKLNEHRQLLNSLSEMRKDCFRRFLESNPVAEEQIVTEEPLAVDPDSNLGNLMKKICPEKVALSAEELCELLKADLLAKNFEELAENDPPLQEPEQ